MPPPFPAKESDLEPWAVYADELQTQGDSRGALIAADLAVRESSTADQLRRFQRLCARQCRLRRERFPWLSVGWCLGHARTLEVNARAVSQRHTSSSFDGLDLARQFLSTREGGTVTTLRVGWLEFRDLDTPEWRNLMAALPAGCRRLEIALQGVTHAFLAQEALARLAPVRELSLLFLGMQPELFVDDRFEELDLRFLRLSPAQLAALTGALARTSRVRVRLGSVDVDDTTLARDRVIVGGEHDAFLRGLTRPGTVLLERTPLIELQRRHGFIAVRAQLHRWLGERWGLGLREQGIWVSPYRGSQLARHRGGRWSLRTTAPLANEPLLALAVNEAEVPAGQTVPLHSGDTVSVLDRALTWRFEAPRALG